MHTIWFILLIALGAVAIVGTLDALLRQHAPRIPIDPRRIRDERDGRDPDRDLDREARRLAASIEERVAHQLDAPGNGLAPQMHRPSSDAPIWAALLPAR